MIFLFFVNYCCYFVELHRFERATDLPSPRCRSLIFATNRSLFCVSGLVEGHEKNNNKKMKISTVHN